MIIKGKLIDNQTRCIHYQSPVDVIAIKFKCCGEYYPCHQCHEECTDHTAVRWSKEERNEKAILCGVCKTELTIQEYLDSSNQCSKCKNRFNPNCSLHYHLYFEI